MKEILSRGVTGILVSHTMGQVREMCDTILWLEKGRQIYFGTDVEMATFAYEESMLVKKVPHSAEDIQQFFIAHQHRLEEEQRKREMTEVQKLVKILEAGTSDATIQAAVTILRKSAPELLKSEKT